MRAKPEWLLEEGTVTGLNKDDIGAIVSVAKLRCAEWSERLAWASGEWTPHRPAEGALGLKCARAPLGFSLSGEELGLSRPRSPGASRAEAWGGILAASALAGLAIAYAAARESRKRR